MGFRRSVSFSCPNGNVSPLPRPRSAAAKSSYRVRSASLPCRFHPLVGKLEDDVRSVRAWAGSSQSGGAAWIGDGLSHLSRLLSSLSDLLHHPQAQEPLRRRSSSQSGGGSGWTERVLEDLLRLADAYGCFRGSLISLNQTQSETQAALRRSDAARLATAVRAQRRAERELARIATAAREIGRSSRFSASGDGAEAMLAASLMDASAAAASASSALFAGIASISAASTAKVAGSAWSQWGACPLASPARFSSPASFSTASPVVKEKSTRRIWWVVDLLRWRRRIKNRSDRGEQVPPVITEQEELEGEEKERRDAMERLQVLEECIRTAESGSAQVYRALVNSRVSLLNILTPSF